MSHTAGLEELPMSRQRPHRPARGLRPRVELLEDRLTPTVVAGQAPGSNLILVMANGPHDAIRVVDQGGSGPGALRVAGTGLAGFRSAAVPAGNGLVIEVFTGRGTDRLDYTLAGGHPSASGRTVVINLGSPRGPALRTEARSVSAGTAGPVHVLVNRAPPAGGFTLALRQAKHRPTVVHVAPSRALVPAPRHQLIGTPSLASLAFTPFGGTTAFGTPSALFGTTTGGTFFDGMQFVTSGFLAGFAGTGFTGTVFPGTTFSEFNPGQAGLPDTSFLNALPGTFSASTGFTNTFAGFSNPFLTSPAGMAGTGLF
jgi:hypothetical protein